MSGGAGHRAYLLLGSNRAPETNLPGAVRALAECGAIAAVSPVYQTVPVGTRDPAPFLNAALLLETDLEPEVLKGIRIAAIEQRLGRVRDPADRNAPRTIDIDIVLWDAFVGEILGRPVPDPDLLRQLHVVWPLVAIAADLRHPVDGRPLAEIAAALAERSALPVPRHDVVLSF